MFKVRTVENCPVTRASNGVITFDKRTVGRIAGAARHDIEWIVLLNGRRSEDGYEVFVDRLTVPTQQRGRAHANIPEMTLDSDVVGVMHLHPWKTQASFSSTDDNTLNPRFPSSVVVSPADNYLGFSYEAVGKVQLPCGAMGMVEFEVAVAEAGEKFAASVVRATHETAGLGDCAHYTVENGELTYDAKAACGVERSGPRTGVFGMDDAGLLEVIAQQTVEPPPTAKGNSYTTGKYYPKYTGGSTLSKKERKRLKKARRNGLVKLERPGEDSAFETLARRNQSVSDTYSFRGKGCDECEIRGTLLQKHAEFDEWLCSDCYAEANAIIEHCLAQEAADSREGSSFTLLGDGSITTSEELEGERLVITLDEAEAEELAAEDNYRQFVERSM